MASTLKVTGVSVHRPLFSDARRVRGGVSRLVVRAEEEKSTSVAKVDRSKETLWFPDENSLSYLDGTVPGDYGFDPFGLLAPGSGDVGFVNPGWLQYAEVMNGRFAMLGVAGCLGPEALSMLGVIPKETGVVWFKSGVFPFVGTEYEYWADPYTLFFIEVVAMQFAELRRLQDYRKPGSMGKQYFLGLEKGLAGSGEPAYPGGPFFNPFGMAKTEAAKKDLRLKEIKNGRLAMMAWLGFALQAILTGKGPVENLMDHIADPVGNNILTNLGRVYGQ